MITSKEQETTTMRHFKIVSTMPTALGQKSARDNHYYQQTDVASATGINTAYISGMMTGNPSILAKVKMVDFAKVAAWLGCEIGDFIRLEPCDQTEAIITIDG